EQRKRRKTRLIIAGVAAIALVAVASGLATFAVWQKQKRQEKQREIEKRGSLASGALLAHDIDRSIALFREYDAFAQASGEESYRPWGQEMLRALEQFRDFRTKAGAALHEGVHNIRSRSVEDTALKYCEAALAVYGLA